MDVSQLLGLFVFVFMLLIFRQYYKQRWPVGNFPPGPTGLPIFGTLFSTGVQFHFHRTASKLVKRYGHVCSFMLETPVVLVDGYEAINRVLTANKGYDFANRKDPAYSFQLTNPQKLGFFMADFSTQWQQQRRFALTTFRGLGIGKSRFEEKIMNEVKTALDELKILKDLESPQDLSHLVTASVANIICDTILGCRFDHHDKEFLKILDILEEWFRTFVKPKMFLLETVPITRLFLKQQAQEMREVAAEVSTFTMGKVVEHEKTFKVGDEPRDFIDCYLAKMAEEPDVFPLEQLKYAVNGFFAAGIETTANTLRFALLYMVTYPVIQDKVHQELMRVVGESRLPCMDDRDQMPYTVATIQEILRLSCVASFIWRCASVDTTLAGYTIPKGTNVICNLWGLFFDPEIWPQPEIFDPNRHLNDNGEVIKHPYLLPFGAGRRVCMGESLAKMKLFLFFSSMMHRFKFEIPPGAATPSLEPVPGFTYSPAPFEVVIKEYT